MAFLTKDMVEEAIGLALPTIRLVCSKHNWGNEGVSIAVDAKGLDEPCVHTMDDLGPKEDWVGSKGDPLDFDEVATNKAKISRAYGETSWSVVNNHPWSLEKDDFLYQGGVAEDTDLGVGVSGSYGDVDEKCAWVVWNMIQLVCDRTRAEWAEEGISRIP